MNCMNLISHNTYQVGQVWFLSTLTFFETKLLEMQKPHCYTSLIQIDASKMVVPAALNLIIENCH